MNDNEATKFLDSLVPAAMDISLKAPSKKEVINYDEGDYKERIIGSNEKIIKECDDLLLDRLEAGDPSLRASDINQIKGEAFKENQLLRGLG